MANVAKDPNPRKQLVLDYICTYARPANVNIPLKWCLPGPKVSNLVMEVPTVCLYVYISPTI